MAGHWCYWKEEIGPQQWQKQYPIASGQRQSPVDIKPIEVLYDPRLNEGRFEFQYNPMDCMELFNKGFTWSIKIRPDSNSYLMASHLPGKFRLIDVHCHWGSDHRWGSEHLVGGKAYAAEIHIVHMNTKYAKFEDALGKGDGLAVLGIFLEESPNDNKALAPLVNCTKCVKYKEDKIDLINGFSIKDLIPKDINFWTYDGSLTTPPCNECVIWTVFRTPIPISRAQIQAFRQLHCSCQKEAGGCGLFSKKQRKIVNNYRPTQPLYGRRIRASFDK